MLNKHLVLHLTLIEDIGPAIIKRVLERSDVNPSDLYSFSHIDWMNIFGFSEGTAEKLVDGLGNTKILEEELTLIEQHNIQWMTFQEEDYPYLLKQIYLPPAVIYVQGELPSAHNPSIHSATLKTSQNTQGERINLSPAHTECFLSSKNVSKYNPRAPENKLLAIVGARKADEYGYRVINQLVPELVAADYTIVSGGALGIDTAAHETTIQSGGTTIAVLGSGLLLPYPSSNKKLFASIVGHGGALVSSFPLRMEPMPGNFPARNRIITGLSHGCLVVQAAQKSGALISAHYALEQGREVFAIPGPLNSELSAGCNALIQQGAKLVTCTADILEEFGDRVILPDLRSFSEVGLDNRVMQEKAIQLSLESATADSIRSNPSIHFEDETLRTSGKKNIVDPAARPECPDMSAVALAKEEGVYRRVAEKDKYSDYSPQQKQIIAACKKPISFDDIINHTQLSFELVQSELFNLQLDGILEQDFMGMWQDSKNSIN